MTTIFTLLIALALASPAIAGTITLNFALRGNQCVVTSRGDSAAYYPVVFQLDGSGRWIALKSDLAAAELLPGGTLLADIPPAAATSGRGDISALQVVMARFFDQAGVAYGQVTVLRSPPPGGTTIPAVYAGRRLRLHAPAPPGTISATWVLVPRDEGIAPTLNAQSFTLHQPPATRIDWRSASHADIETGPTLPTVMLLHETADGFALQTVQSGRARPSEQRSPWLGMARLFYLMALVCGIGGVGLLYMKRPSGA